MAPRQCLAWSICLLVLISSIFAYGDLDPEENGIYPRSDLMSDYQEEPWDLLDLLIPNRRLRSPRKCFKRFCEGVCCGGKRCCKKGWKCRYMSNLRTYTCIP